MSEGRLHLEEPEQTRTDPPGSAATADPGPAAPAIEGGGAPAAGGGLNRDWLMELERVRNERDEYLDLARRTRAEFENYRKRITAQQAEFRERAAESMIGRVLIPTLDALEAGVRHHPDALAPVQRVASNLASSEGLERIEPVGASYDPKEHEAVVFDDNGAGTDVMVVEVLRPGYRWRGRLVRPAAVRVSRAAEVS